MSTPAVTINLPRRLRRTSSGVALPRVDGRLRASRRFKELVETLGAEPGGDLSELQMSQLWQLAIMTMQSEVLAADVVRGIRVDGDLLIRTNSEIRRLREQIGIKPAAENEAAEAWSPLRARLMQQEVTE